VLPDLMGRNGGRERHNVFCDKEEGICEKRGAVYRNGDDSVGKACCQKSRVIRPQSLTAPRQAAARAF